MMRERELEPDQGQDFARFLRPREDPHPAPASLRLFEQNQVATPHISVSFGQVSNSGLFLFYRQLLRLFRA